MQSKLSSQEGGE